MLPGSEVDRGWAWVALVSSFLSNFVLGGMNITSGLIHSTLLDSYGRDNTQTAWVGALFTALMNLSGPLSSAMVGRLGCRTTIILSGLFFTAGFLGTAFSPSLEVSILTCGVVAGVAGGVGWTCNIASMGFYFRRYQNLAQGVAIAGVGVGIFGIPPIVQAARDSYGHFGFFLAMAGISIHLTVFGMLLRPSVLELETQRARRIEARMSGVVGPMRFVKEQLDVFLCKPVLCLSLSIFMFSVGLYTLFIYLPSYFIHKGSTQMQASLAISACGIASILGRILAGVAANSEDIDEALLYSCSMSIVGLSCFFLPLISRFYLGQVLFAVIAGTYFGTSYVVIGTLNKQCVGVQRMTAALGIEMCLGGAGAIFGPISGGSILDSGGTYEQVFVVSGVGWMLSGLFALLSVVFREAVEPPIPELKVEEEVELTVLSSKTLTSSQTTPPLGRDSTVSRIDTDHLETEPLKET